MHYADRLGNGRFSTRCGIQIEMPEDESDPSVWRRRAGGAQIIALANSDVTTCEACRCGLALPPLSSAAPVHFPGPFGFASFLCEAPGDHANFKTALNYVDVTCPECRARLGFKADRPGPHWPSELNPIDPGTREVLMPAIQLPDPLIEATMVAAREQLFGSLRGDDARDAARYRWLRNRLDESWREEFDAVADRGIAREA